MFFKWDAPPTLENAIFDEYKECELIVNIWAFRDGKIDNIVNEAKQIPSQIVNLCILNQRYFLSKIKYSVWYVNGIAY